MQGLSMATPVANSAELAWATVLGESVADIAWLPSGEQLFAGTAEGELCGYQADADCRYRIQAHQRGLTRISPCPLGKTIATTGEDGGVLLWRADTGERMQILARDHDWAEHLAWSPDGKTLAGAAGSRLYLRDANGRTSELDGHPGNVAAMAWAPKGRKLASATNKGVYLWNVGSRQPTQVLSFPGSAVSLDWSHDGRALAAGTQDGFLYIRLQLPGCIPRQLNMSGYPGKVTGLSWHPKRLRVATCGGSDVVLWELDATKGKRHATPLRRHCHTVTTLTYSPDGNLLASADRHGRLCIWDEDGLVAFEMELGTEITSLAWHPGAQRLAVGSVDGLLRLFILGEQR
ncbi:MAG: WD40 repeat domain-containing protein [Candidatus Thiodiazotropha sp.]